MLVKFSISHQDKCEKTEENAKEKGKFPYREAGGSLLYLACKTRPDLNYAVNYESRSVNDPKRQDIVNVKRTLRYLNCNKKNGIFYSSLPTEEKYIKIQAYCDSDFAGNPRDRKSTTGFVILIAD